MGLSVETPGRLAKPNRVFFSGRTAVSDKYIASSVYISRQSDEVVSGKASNQRYTGFLLFTLSINICICSDWINHTMFFMLDYTQDSYYSFAEFVIFKFLIWLLSLVFLVLGIKMWIEFFWFEFWLFLASDNLGFIFSTQYSFFFFC